MRFVVVFSTDTSKMTWEWLQVRENFLQEDTMHDVTAVDQAVAWAKALTQTEARGPGDMQNAWHRLEARYGIPWRAFWSFRYRRPKDVNVSIYVALKGAYDAERGRQLNKLRHELEIAKATTRADQNTVDAYASMVDQEKG